MRINGIVKLDKDTMYRFGNSENDKFWDCIKEVTDKSFVGYDGEYSYIWVFTDRGFVPTRFDESEFQLV